MKQPKIKPESSAHFVIAAKSDLQMRMISALFTSEL